MKVGATVNVNDDSPPASWSLEHVEAWLLFQVNEILSNKKTFAATGDLFEQGLDSLGATILRHRIAGTLQASKRPSSARFVTQSVIYEHSSVLKLARFVVTAITNPDRLASTTSRVDEIERMITKFSSPKSDASRDKKSVVVLITGTTGNLGAQLVDSFLHERRVTRVYTLNRPSSGEKDIVTRHEERFIDKGLDTAQLSDDRLFFLEGDASHVNLGLGDELYEEVWICTSDNPFPKVDKRMFSMVYRSEIASTLSFTMLGDWISTSPCPLLSQTFEARNTLSNLLLRPDKRRLLDFCSLPQSPPQVLGITLKGGTRKMLSWMLDMQLGTDMERANMSRKESVLLL